MPIKSPYTRELTSYSPQRSAGIGRRAVLPQEYGLGYRGAVKPQPTTVDEMIYAAPQGELTPDTFGGGPGIAGEGLEGTTDPAQQAINASILGIDNPIGFMMGKGNPASMLLGMAMRGGNQVLGDPLGQAKDFIAGKLGLGQSAQGMLGQIGQTSENAVNAALEASIPESIDVDVDFPDMSDVSLPDFGPPSPLGDIGIGGGFGAAGDVGNAGFGGLGGSASY